VPTLEEIIAGGSKKATARKPGEKKRNFLQSALGSLGDSPIGKGAAGFLDAFDTPRAAVGSFASELTDLGADVFNLPGHEYVDASFGDFIKQTRDNTGFGTILREKTAAAAAAGDNTLFGVKMFKNPEVLKKAPKGSKAFKEFLKSEDGKALKTTKGGTIASVAGGLAGDILGDPLTYVSMGSSVALRGASARSLAAKAMEAGDAKLAQKIFTKGKWAMTPDDLAKIGMEGQGGIKFNAPFTGKVGQKLGLAKEAAEFTLPKSESLMRYTPVGAYHSVTASIRKGGAESWVARNLGGKWGGTLGAMALKGTPEQFGTAFNTMLGDQAAQGTQKVFGAAADAKYLGLVKKLEDADIDGRTVMRALGDPDGVSEWSQSILVKDGGPQLLAEIRAFADGLIDDVNGHAGAEVLTHRRGWQPSMRPQETKDYLAKKYGKRTGGRSHVLGKSGPEMPAEIVAGEEFLGEVLLDPVKDADLLMSKYKKVLDPREQAQKIIEDRAALLGEKTVMAMFEDDFFIAMPAVIRDLGHRVYRKNLEVELLRRGVAKNMWSTVSDADLMVDWDAAVTAKAVMADRRMAHAVLAAQVGDAKSALGRLKTAAKVVGNVNESRKARRGAALAGVVREAKGRVGTAAQSAVDAHTAAMGLQKALPELAAGNRVLAATLDDLTLTDSPEFVAALAEMAVAREGLDRTQGVMGGLLRKREDLLGKLGRAEAKIDARIEKAAKTDAIRAAWQQEIDHTEDLIADLKAASQDLVSTGNPSVRDDLAEAVAKNAQIDEAIAVAAQMVDARAMGVDADAVGMAKLRNNFWTDLSRFDPEDLIGKLNRVKPELGRQIDDLQTQVDMLDEIPDIAGITDDIDRAAVSLENARNEIAELGGTDEQLERYTKLQAQLPIVDGAVINNPANTEGLWHFAVPSKVDMTSPKSFKAAASGVENGLGVRLSQSAATGVPDAQVVLKASAPKVYGADKVDYAVDGAVRFSATGSRQPHAVRQLRNDMLEHAIYEGIVTAKMMPKYKSQWAQVVKNLDEGATLKQAVYKAFGPRGGGLKADGSSKAVIDMLGVGRRVRDESNIGDGDWMLSQLAERLLGDAGELSADVKSAISDSFRSKLSATNDVIILPSSTDEWQTIVLRPSAVVSETGEAMPNLVTLDAAMRASDTIINGEANKLRELDAAIGTDLNVAFGDYTQLQHRLIDSSARMAEIEQQFEKTRRTMTRSLGERLDFEFHLRDEIDRLGVAANANRAEAEGILKTVAGIADMAGQAEARDTAKHLELLAQVADHEAAAKLVEADFMRKSARLAKDQSKLDKRVGRLMGKMAKNESMTGDELSKLVRLETLPYGTRMLADGVYADDWVVHAIDTMTDSVASPDGVKQILKVVDSVTNYWKSQALLRPGFHARNYLGGVYNNAQAGVQLGDYQAFRTRWKAYRDGGLENVAKKYSQADADRLAQIIDTGVITGGQSAEGQLIGGAIEGNLRPWSSEFKLFQGNRKVMGFVENELRGSMAWNRLGKGFDADAMVQDVYRYHFDYDDLAKLERKAIRRVIPFYTWTRKNVPVQIEMALENPKYILRFMHAKRNIEMASEEQDIYPEWYDKQLTVRLPWANKEGNPMTYFADLPFASVPTAMDPRSWIEDVNPLIKTPLEMKAGKKYFADIPFKDGYMEVPGIWDTVGVSETMALFGKAKRAEDGTWMARDKDLYMVEQWLPVLGQVRKLLPTEEKYQARQAFTWMTFFTGQTVRATTQDDLTGEMRRRERVLAAKNKDRTDLGTLGFAGG
jgi:hypothetical protein